MSVPRFFDPGRAFAHVERLSFPRRVGSLGERRAARAIVRELTAMGLVCRRESFRVAELPVEVGTRLVFLACMLLAFLGAFCVERWPVASAVLWLLAARLVDAPWRVMDFLGDRWPSRRTAENLVATDPDAPTDAPARVVVMAHYDSKSQLVPTGYRVVLVAATAIGCLLLAAVAVGKVAGYGLLLRTGIARDLVILVYLQILGLIVNLTGNRSPGAIDNASGVGVLLELARTLPERPEAPVEVVWVATGSEEVGLDGARDFLRRHASLWRSKPTLLINLESVGFGDRVFLSGEPGALALAERVAGDAGMSTARFKVMGAGMDHEPFAARGLPALSLLGDVVRASLLFHSRRDNLSRVDPAALDRAGVLAARLIASWADRHQAVIAAEVAEEVAIT
ncbi:MAG TPA: M28 family peptidase [Isosphaeraceae bacterium]|nr:M28 family peptidase [Isosphaeraceae bacterium]